MMTIPILLSGLAILMASANVQFQGGLMVSPLSENSNQNNEICISYLNSTLSEFLVKLNRPANTNNTGSNSIGKEAEDIINKKMTNLMLRCKGAVVSTPQEIANHFKKDGKSFYVEQLAVQIFNFKPRQKSDVNNIIEIEKLKASLIQIDQEKKEEEHRGSQKLSLAANKTNVIGKLGMRLQQVIRNRDHEYQSGNRFYVRLQQSRNELVEEKKKYVNLKEKYDEIMKIVCGCQRCRTNQSPNNWAAILEPGRNVDEQNVLFGNITTQDSKISN